jgi:hypothetical protein
MSQGPGETCLYKDGESANFSSDCVDVAMKDGWKDTPQPKKEVKPEVKPEQKKGK